MQANLIWTSRYYQSIENCVLHTSATGSHVIATIIGHYEKSLFKVEYETHLAKGWEVQRASVRTQFGNKRQTLILEKENGGWTLNGKPTPALRHCVDIDISLTPFTNTLPINRLQLPIGRSETIAVVYIDVLHRKIKPATQFYTRLSADKYRFKTFDKSFRATITVDKDGLVMHYPALFTMAAKHSSRFQPKELSPFKNQ